MTEYRYLDTCAVVGWCCASKTPAIAIDVACASEVDSLLADHNVEVAISELTLIELHDSLAKFWRMADKPQFDEQWAKDSMSKVMGAIQSETLVIVSSPPKAAEHAMLLVTLATRDHGVKFKAWDATHLLTAARWSHSLGHQVTIVTADDDFERFLNLYPHFVNFVGLKLVKA